MGALHLSPSERAIWPNPSIEGGGMQHTWCPARSDAPTSSIGGRGPGTPPSGGSGPDPDRPVRRKSGAAAACSAACAGGEVCQLEKQTCRYCDEGTDRGTYRVLRPRPGDLRHRKPSQPASHAAPIGHADLAGGIDFRASPSAPPAPACGRGCGSTGLLLLPGRPAPSRPAFRPRAPDLRATYHCRLTHASRIHTLRAALPSRRAEVRDHGTPILGTRRDPAPACLIVGL
jgi:hypothetical protein